MALKGLVDNYIVAVSAPQHNKQQNKSYMIMDQFIYFYYFFNGKFKSFVNLDQYYSTWIGRSGAFEIMMVYNNHIIFNHLNNMSLQNNLVNYDLILNYQSNKDLKEQRSGKHRNKSLNNAKNNKQ